MSNDISSFVVADPSGEICLYRMVTWFHSLKASTSVPKALVDRADGIVKLLNRHRRSPAIQMWLKSGYNQSMTLEDFLNATLGGDRG